MRDASGAPVAQYLKRWTADLVVLCWSHLEEVMFSIINKVPLHTAFLNPPIVLV